MPATSAEAACSSFIYALSIADKFIRLGEARRVLVVGSETLSRITDFTDRTTAILFSDGAGALVLEASETQGVVSTHLHADGSYQNLLYCTGGISKGYEPGSDNRPLIRMAGREVFKIAVNMLGNVVDEVLLYCYHYDPATGKYGAVVTRILRLSGAATILVMGIGLVVANLLVANLWLANFTSARVDVTKGRLYSISPATTNYIDLRIDKSFALGRAQRVAFRVNFFNLLNANTVQTWNQRAGSTYLYPTLVLRPRLMEFGVHYTF